MSRRAFFPSLAPIVALALLLVASCRSREEKNQPPTVRVVPSIKSAKSVSDLPNTPGKPLLTWSVDEAFGALAKGDFSLDGRKARVEGIVHASGTVERDKRNVTWVELTTDGADAPIVRTLLEGEMDAPKKGEKRSITCNVRVDQPAAGTPAPAPASSATAEAQAGQGKLILRDCEVLSPQSSAAK